MLHVTSEPTDPSAVRSLTPFELGRIKALATALLPGWFYDTEKTDTRDVYACIEDPRGSGAFLIEGDQRGGVTVSDPSSNVVLTHVSLGKRGLLAAYRGACKCEISRLS